MGSHMKRFNRQQVTLLPECLDDYIGEYNPVRVVDASIYELDLCSLGFELMSLTGRSAPDFKTIADFRHDNGQAFATSVAASHAAS